MKFKKIILVINEEVIKDIERINHYLNATEKSEDVHTVESFIIGSVIKELDNLTTVNELSGIFSEDRPYKLKNRFKEISENLRLKQIDVSNRTGINPTTLNLIYQNKHQPSLDNFLRLWVILGYPPFTECLYKETEEQ